MSNQSKNYQSVFIQQTKCVACGRLLNATRGITAPEPKEGDFSVCSYCGQLMIFTADKKMRRLRVEELIQLKKDHPEALAVAQKCSEQLKALKAQREN